MSAAASTSKPRLTVPPEVLPGATDFSDNAGEVGGEWVMRTLKAHPQFWDELARATDLDGRFGRRRLPGRWALAYLAFVVSRQADVQPWWNDSPGSLWREAGFDRRPSYPTVQRRFAELEAAASAFEQAAGKLIHHAVKQSGGRVGRHLHVDSTEAQTNARLEHACPPGAACPRRAAAARARAAAGTLGRSGELRVSAAASSHEVHEERHLAAEQPPPEDPDTPDVGDADDLEEVSGEKYLVVGGCRYKLLDDTAGARAYTDRRTKKVKRFWTGFYNAKAVDHYTGAPVAILLTSASEQEYYAYPKLLARATKATKAKPAAVIADRGYSVESVFKHNTVEGIASVIHWRKPNGTVTDRGQEDDERWDRHGIVRCKHCGAPTRYRAFIATSKVGPRLRVRCTAETLPACLKEQTIRCAENWRLLVPLWRTHETYHALRASHDRYERVHHLWRRRYRVGADDHQLRPKRRGIACQQLRADAALLVEWLTILWREGWLGSARRNRTLADPTKATDADRGKTRAANLAAERLRHGLTAPYGAAAKSLGIGPRRPPKPPPRAKAAKGVRGAPPATAPPF